MTDSLPPRSAEAPDTRYQPSLLSLPSAARTVSPQQPAAQSSAPTPKRGARRKLWFFTALSALAAVGGAGLLSARRGPAQLTRQVHSGSPAYRLSKSGQKLHWHTRHVTVYLDASLDRAGPGAKEAVMQAFGTWVQSDPKLPDLTFDTGQTSSIPQRDGKSTVSFGHINVPGHEHDVGITVSYANDHTGEIVEADVVLNAIYAMGTLTPKPSSTSASDTNGQASAWGSGSRDGAGEAMSCDHRYDVQNVTTHEAGHFFGLGEDLVERQATMFQSIDQCETHKRALASTDVGAVTTLYAQADDSSSSDARQGGCSFTSAPTGSSALLACGSVLGLALLGRRRAPRRGKPAREPR